MNILSFVNLYHLYTINSFVYLYLFVFFQCTIVFGILIIICLSKRYFSFDYLIHFFFCFYDFPPLLYTTIHLYLSFSLICVIQKNLFFNLLYFFIFLLYKFKIFIFCFLYILSFVLC